MDDFPFPQELQRIPDIGVVDETEQVVIGDAGFLLCGDAARTTLPASVPFPLPRRREGGQKFQWISMGTSRVPGILLPTTI